MAATTGSAELVDTFDEFFRTYYENEIAELAQNYPRDQKSLYVEWGDLYRYDPEVADDFRKKPGQIREYLEEALRNFALPVDVSLSQAHVRVTNVPDQHILPVGAYNSDDIGRFIGVRGQVQKQTDDKPRPTSAAFVCQRCGTLTRIPQHEEEMQEPHECQGCERQGPFRLDEAQTEWTDFQKLRLQLPPEQSRGGSSPTIDVYCEDDLADQVDAGDRVIAAGQLTVDTSDMDEVTFDQRLDAHSLTVEETDFEDIAVDEHREEIEALAAGEHGDPYDLLTESIGTDIYGMETIKLALGLQLFGGCRIESPDGLDRRGDPHILLLGDPGTAKSSLLEDIATLAPRSTYASGKGAKAAGMTAAAVKDDFGDGQWTLEAGALVEADKGIACVDELDKVDEDAVSSLHGALSRQKVSISKAGINADIPTRTTMLAAGNPKYGRFREDRPIGEQIELGPTLLSRFDLMFMVADNNDAEEDAEITEGMIKSRYDAARWDRDGGTRPDSVTRAVDAEVLRAWVALAKQTVMPVIEDPDVAQELKESFWRFRQINGDDDDAPIPVTWRKLEALMRIAEASARVRLSNSIEMQDIDRARELIGRSLRDVGMDPESGQFDADIVETGASQSQKDKLEWVVGYIRAEEGPDAVGHETVVEAGMENDFERGDIEYALQKLLKKGELYQPETDHYRSS